MKKTLAFLLSLLCVVTCHSTAFAQQDTTKLLITLVDDEAGNPVAGMKISLELIRYAGAGPEKIPVDPCVTDKAGQCSFELANPPRLADGQAEAFVIVENLRTRIGWNGNQAEITISMSDLKMKANLQVGVESAPYEYEEGTLITDGSELSQKPSATKEILTAAGPTGNNEKPKIGILTIAIDGTVLCIIVALAYRSYKAGKRK